MLFVKVQLVAVNVPLFQMAPPCLLAELPIKVTFFRVTLALFRTKMAPPQSPAPLFWNVQPVMVSELLGQTLIPPPLVA